MTPWTVALLRQEYWSGLPCPPPGDLPDLGMKLASPVAPALQADSLPQKINKAKNWFLERIDKLENIPSYTDQEKKS